MQEPTLVHALAARAREPERVMVWIESLDQPTIEITAGRLPESAQRMARGILRVSGGRCPRVLVLLPTSPEFLYVFYGALGAGCVAVPAYPPAGLGQVAAFGSGITRIAGAISPCIAVTVAPLCELLRVAVPGLERVVTTDELWEAGAVPHELPAPPSAQDLAFIQFSSGSTGDPRGICLTHHNVLSNVDAMSFGTVCRPDDVLVSWLPLCHDMGLVGMLLTTLALRLPLVLMSPLDFLRHPALWFRVLAKHRGTISVGPQFAYTLCLRKLDPVRLSCVDLSSVRLLLNGSEPIHAEAVLAFEERFAPLGLRAGTVTPCYGLAETALAVSLGRPGAGLRLRSPSPRNDEPGASGEGAAAVSVGPPVPGTEVRILSDGATGPDGTVGEICLRGPSVCREYLTAQGAVAALDEGGWLHTGDLGFLSDGELFVVGRLKDVIIVGGRNIYPQEVEQEAYRIGGLRAGRAAAFGTTDASRGTQAIVLVAETTEQEAKRLRACAVEIRQRVARRFGVAPVEILLLGRSRLPLTTSGKVRRFSAREQYEHGQFEDVVYRWSAAGGSDTYPL